MTESEVMELARTLRDATAMAKDVVPRLGRLETWRDVLDAPEPVGGLPIRMQKVEGVIRDLKASWGTFRAFSAVAALGLTLLTIYAYVHG